MVGVLPTKTSVQLRDRDGGMNTIPEATPTAAGVMSAAQARMLEEVYRWHQAMEAGGVVQILPPAPAPAPGLPQLAAVRDGVAQIGQRVARLEADLAAAHRGERLAPGEDAAARLASAEERIAILAGAMQELAGIVDDIQHRLAFVEAHALAGVEVEAREEGKAA